MGLVCASWFFFCKQKTAYEMRISDWSSDVCSSDLALDRVLQCLRFGPAARLRQPLQPAGQDRVHAFQGHACHVGSPPAASSTRTRPHNHASNRARKSAVSGKSVSVRVDLGVRRILKKTTLNKTSHSSSVPTA